MHADDVKHDVCFSPQILWEHMYCKFPYFHMKHVTLEQVSPSEEGYGLLRKHEAVYVLVCYGFHTVMLSYRLYLAEN